MTPQERPAIPGLDGWTRMHPLSPLLGGWAVITALGSVALQQQVSPRDLDRMPLGRFGMLIAIVVVVALAAIGFSYLAWWFHSFRVTDEAIEQRKGVLTRQVKRAPLDRMQAVDVVQPLLARVLGLATVKIEVAGGQGSAVVLQHLRRAEAEALRAELVALASGSRAGEHEQAPADAGLGLGDGAAAGAAADAGTATARVGRAAFLEPEPSPLITVPVTRAVASVLLSGATIVAGVVMIGFLVAAFVVHRRDPEVNLLAMMFGGGAVGVALGLFGWASQAVTALNRSLRFRLGVAPEGVRLSHGLLETTRQTIPPGRVQAVRLQQPLLWRTTGWWRATVNVAGYHDEAQKASVLVPVGTVAETRTALWAVMPHVADDLGDQRLEESMGGGAPSEQMLASPLSARWLDPFGARRRGVLATEDGLVIRSGWLTREVVVVPHERIQSLGLKQGPVQRRLGLATVAIHSTVGPIRPVAEHLAVADAVTLVKEEAVRAHSRRAAATPERWLEAVRGGDGQQ